MVLWLLVRLRHRSRSARGNWPSALVLFGYAACFSYADLSLSAATGALLLFGAVQATMIDYAIWYAALPRLQATTVATVQLSVPVLAAFGPSRFSAKRSRCAWSSRRPRFWEESPWSSGIPCSPRRRDPPTLPTMLGIEICGNDSTVVAWTEAGLEPIGVRAELGQLVRIAQGRAGVEAGWAVVAVPAWYHDGQRREVRERVLAAGIENVRIVNEPVAIALAYGMTQPALPKNSLVLSLSDGGVFDVTVLSLRASHVEVMAANGIPELGAEVCASGKSLFAAIEPVVKRALADAGMPASTLEAIVLAGRTAVLRSVESEIETAWGRKPAEPPSPERAIAEGAAICGRMRRDKPPVPAPEATTSPKSGCAGVFALVLAAVVALKLLADGWLPG